MQHYNMYSDNGKNANGNGKGKNSPKSGFKGKRRWGAKNQEVDQFAQRLRDAGVDETIIDTAMNEKAMDTSAPQKKDVLRQMQSLRDKIANLDKALTQLDTKVDKAYEAYKTADEERIEAQGKRDDYNQELQLLVSSQSDV